jgi:hypothetical protein
MRQNFIYHISPRQAAAAFGKAMSIADPPKYKLDEGGTTETGWVDIYREEKYLGRYTFSPVKGGTKCSLNWDGGLGTENYMIMSLMDFQAKQLEVQYSAEQAPTKDKTAKPEKPPAPKRGSNIDDWFTYYHALKRAGFKITFPMLAEESGYSANTFKEAHGRYKAEQGID